MLAVVLLAALGSACGGGGAQYGETCGCGPDWGFCDECAEGLACTDWSPNRCGNSTCPRCWCNYRCGTPRQ